MTIGSTHPGKVESSWIAFCFIACIHWQCLRPKRVLRRIESCKSCNTSWSFCQAQPPRRGTKLSRVWAGQKFHIFGSVGGRLSHRLRKKNGLGMMGVKAGTQEEESLEAEPMAPAQGRKCQTFEEFIVVLLDWYTLCPFYSTCLTLFDYVWNILMLVWLTFHALQSSVVSMFCTGTRRTWKEKQYWWFMIEYHSKIHKPSFALVALTSFVLWHPLPQPSHQVLSRGPERPIRSSAPQQDSVEEESTTPTRWHVDNPAKSFVSQLPSNY